MAQPTKKNENEKGFNSQSGETATHVNQEKEMKSEKPGLRSVKSGNQGQVENKNEEDEEVLGQEDEEEGSVRNFRENQKSTDKGSRDNAGNS